MNTETKQFAIGQQVIIHDQITISVLDYGQGPKEPMSHICKVQRVAPTNNIGVVITDRSDNLQPGPYALDFIINELGLEVEQF